MNNNRILIINQQQDSTSNILTASLNLPKNLTHEVIEEVVHELKLKLLKELDLNKKEKPIKRVFSNIVRKPVEKPEALINSLSDNYQKEVETMKIEQVIEALKFLKVIDERVINFVTHEKELGIKNKPFTISINKNSATLQSPQFTIINLDTSDLIYNIHKILNEPVSLEEFSKSISYAWDNISY